MLLWRNANTTFPKAEYLCIDFVCSAIKNEYLSLWSNARFQFRFRRILLCMSGDNNNRKYFLQKWKQQAVTEYWADKKQSWTNAVSKAATYYPGYSVLLLWISLCFFFSNFIKARKIKPRVIFCGWSVQRCSYFSGPRVWLWWDSDTETQFNLFHFFNNCVLQRHSRVNGSLLFDAYVPV